MGTGALARCTREWPRVTWKDSWCEQCGLGHPPRHLQTGSSPLYWGLEAPQSILRSMLSIYTAPKATGFVLYWAVGCQPTGLETTPKLIHSSSVLGSMLSIYTPPKATGFVLYWAVWCQPTGPETTPKLIHSSSVLCWMLSSYTTPKPLHFFYTRLYVADLHGLKQPQSR